MRQEVINESSWMLERRVLPTVTSEHSLNSTARCGPALDHLVPAPPLGVSPYATIAPSHCCAFPVANSVHSFFKKYNFYHKTLAKKVSTV